MELMWFGKRGTGVAFKESPQTETPVGQKCGYCVELILLGDNGWIMGDGTILHHECHLRGIIGSVAHQEKRCFCFGGWGSDADDGMTRRQGARAALEFFEAHPPVPWH